MSAKLAVPAVSATELAPALVLTGDFQFARGEKVVQPQIQSRMLLWCKAGRGRVVVNGEATEIETKDALFLPWNRALTYEADARAPFLVGGIHLIPRHDRSHPVRFHVPHSNADAMTGCAWREDAGLEGLEGIRRGRFGAQDPFELLAEYLVAKFRGCAGAEVEAGTDAEARELAGVFLREAAGFFNRDVGGGGGADGGLPPDLRRMLRFAEHHLNEPLSLNTLARFSGLSRSKIGRMFRRHLKATPVEWITEQRIETAQRLLATTTANVGAIGRQVGIPDPYYFSKLFKSATGLTAKEYRRTASMI